MVFLSTTPIFVLTEWTLEPTGGVRVAVPAPAGADSPSKWQNGCRRPAVAASSQRNAACQAATPTEQGAVTPTVNSEVPDHDESLR